MPRPTQGRRYAYPYRAITVYGAPFQTLPVRTIRATGLVRVRSPLLAESLLMSFPPATEMFQFAGFAPYGYGFTARCRRSGGFPHSEILGLTLARNSPRLIAACYVLHRLSVPRHPPDALAYLIPCARCQMRAWPVPPPPRRAGRTRTATLANATSTRDRLVRKDARIWSATPTPRHEPERPSYEPLHDSMSHMNKRMWMLATLASGRSLRAAPAAPLVEVIGFEPTTPCLQSRCSPD